MNRKPMRFKVLPVVATLLLALTGGGLSPAPALCQEDEDDDSCTVEKITHEDGWLCLHGLECDNMTADELCFKIGAPN